VTLNNVSLDLLRGLHHGLQIVSFIGKDVQSLTGAQDGILYCKRSWKPMDRNVLFTLYVCNLNGKSK